MDNFKVIYKILAVLNKYKGQNFDLELISASAMKIDFPAWEQIMIELQENGYIKGLQYQQTLSDRYPHITEPISPRITLQGMAYLSENSMMSKAEKALHMLGEFV